MKKFLVILSALAISMFSYVSSADAHTGALTGAGVCNTSTGNYDLTWNVTGSNLNLSPKISASNNASIPVGSDVPGTFKQTVPGNSTSISSSITIRWSDEYSSSPSYTIELDGKCSPPPPSNCPEGTTKISDNPLTCLKETVKEITHSVEVPGPTVYVDKIVFGVCPANTTTVSGSNGPICLSVVTKVVTHTKTNTVIKWKIKKYIVYKYKYKSTCPTGTIKKFLGGKWVCAVPGNG